MASLDLWVVLGERRDDLAVAVVLVDSVHWAEALAHWAEVWVALLSG